MAIEASNLTEKDELITKFYTVRAGLSVIAKESSKIRLAESKFELAKIRDSSHDRTMEKKYKEDHENYNNRVQKLEEDMFLAKEVLNAKERLLSDRKKEKKKIEATPAKKYYKDEYGKLIVAVNIIVGILTFFASFMGIMPILYSLSRDLGDFLPWILQMIFAIFSTFVVCSTIYTIITKKIGKKNKSREILEMDREIKNREEILHNAEQEFANAKAEYENYLSCRPKREDYSFYKYREDVIEAENEMNAVVAAATATAKAAKEALVEYTEGLLVEDDWKNVDLLIFYLKTGRANSLQDALLLVDTQRRTDQITEAISVAAKYVGSSLEKVSVRIDSLSANMTKELNRLGSTIERNNSYLISAVSGTSAILGSQINRFNEEMSRQNQALLKAQDVNNALLERANTQSDELMEELRYNQKYWVK